MGCPFPVKWTKFIPDIIKLPIYRKLTKTVYNALEKQEGKEIPAKIIKEKGKAQILGMVVPDLYDTFNYVQKIKNPRDYLKAINELCERVVNPDKTTGFITYYREFIRKTPKLFIYGLKDEWIRPLWKKRKSYYELQRELEEYYKKFGANEIVRIPDAMHALNKEGKDTSSFESGRMPRITYKIVTFLNNYLGRGRLV